MKKQFRFLFILGLICSTFFPSSHCMMFPMDDLSSDDATTPGLADRCFKEEVLEFWVNSPEFDEKYMLLKDFAGALEDLSDGLTKKQVQECLDIVKNSHFDTLRTASIPVIIARNSAAAPVNKFIDAMEAYLEFGSDAIKEHMLAYHRNSWSFIRQLRLDEKTMVLLKCKPVRTRPQTPPRPSLENIQTTNEYLTARNRQRKMHAAIFLSKENLRLFAKEVSTLMNDYELVSV